MAGRLARVVGCLVTAGLLATGLLAMGCAGTREQPTASLQRMGEAAIDKVAFADELALLDQKQMAMVAMALERSNNPEVRAFAQQLGEDHAQHLAGLEMWANAKALEVAVLRLTPAEGVGGSGMPGSDEQLSAHADSRLVALEAKAEEARRDLQALEARTGADFDAAFLAQVHSDQEAGLQLVKRGRTEFAGDDSLTGLLAQTEPALLRHVEAAAQLRGGRQSPPVPQPE